MITNKPNVILIAADQWRGDCISAAGHPLVRTPTLDQIAGRGARFTNAYSATPTCIPARTALMTGLSQESHRRVGYQDGVPFDYPVTMAREFGRGGYQTRAIGKMHLWPERSRAGFDEVVLHDGYVHHSRRRDRAYELFDDYLTWLRHQDRNATADYVSHGLSCNSITARPWDKREDLHPTTWVVTEAISWLYRRDVTAPFFLYLSFHRPHPPYDPPRWAFEQYLDTPEYMPAVGDWSGLFDQWRAAVPPADAFAGWFDRNSLHRARAGYYGHMAHIDAQINRLLEALAEFGLAENTAIAFVSDHGEMLGEHGLFRKGFPYQGSVRVPFLLAGHDGGPVGADVVCDEPVELRDVMPTLLECAGLQVPDGLDGRSVLPLTRGENPDWRDYLHGEHTLLDQSMQWLTDGREKYVWLSGSGHEQLFDLVADPLEIHDLAALPEYAERVRCWRSRLVENLDGREEGYVEHGKLTAGKRPRELLSASVSLAAR